MAVVRSHDDALVPFLLNLKEGLHHFIHRHVAFKVVRLVEVPFAVALSAAEMNKIDAVPEATHHGRQVVVGSHTKRTRAEAETVGRAWHGIDECLKVLGSTEDTRQTQYRHGRVVGVNDQSYAGFLCCGTHLA